MRHTMGWSSSDDDEYDEVIANTLCHPLCQCHKCAPTQKFQASLMDVNETDEQGRSALHIAAEKGDVEIISILLQKHIDVNARTDLVQSTALQIACQQLVPNEKLVQLLLDHGAKVNCKDCNGRTPLHFSSQTGATGITKKLLQAGANVLAANSKGNTPLHEAAKVNNTDTVAMLLEYNANPFLTNRNGLTPLQLTTESRITNLLTEHIEVLKYNNVKGSAKPRALTPNLRQDIFSALEAHDSAQVDKLLASIHTFNRRTLRRTITRDMSAPFIDVKAIIVEEDLIAAVNNSLCSPITAQSDVKLPNIKENKESKDQQPAESVMSVIDKEDSHMADAPVSLSQPDQVIDVERPECDLHFSSGDAHCDSEGERLSEDSNTESADES